MMNAKSIPSRRTSRNSGLAKRAGLASLALILSASSTVPALAANADKAQSQTSAADARVLSLESTATSANAAAACTGNANASAGATEIANAHSQEEATSTVSGQATEKASEIVSQTVALTPSGEAASQATTVKASAVADASEASAAYAAEDTEVCTWSYDGASNTWSTMRGGSKMTVSNAASFGIDVSEWQGEIDWDSVKSAGVQYAILRCAYGSEESGHEDARFAANVQGCKENGIPFGIYLYSNNCTVDGAAAEASFALAAMERAGVTPSDLALPVYYDIEDKAHREMTAEARGDLAETFCNAIEGAGYSAGVYASQSWFDNLLTDARFGNWSKWVASYPASGTEGATSSYTGQHDIWQCMSRGKVDGISTRVDINFDYSFGEAAYSAIYDYEHYMASNADLAEAFGSDRLAAFNHFITTGMAEGRESSAEFNVHSYFNANVDLRREFGLDLKSYYLHYQKAGLAEGRTQEGGRVPSNLIKGMHVMDFSAIYDPYVYLANYDDLREKYTLNAQGYEYIDDAGLFQHFISVGLAEGRVAK